MKYEVHDISIYARLNRGVFELTGGDEFLEEVLLETNDESEAKAFCEKLDDFLFVKSARNGRSEEFRVMVYRVFDTEKEEYTGAAKSTAVYDMDDVVEVANKNTADGADADVEIEKTTRDFAFGKYKHLTKY